MDTNNRRNRITNTYKTVSDTVHIPTVLALAVLTIVLVAITLMLRWAVAIPDDAPGTILEYFISQH